MATSDEKDPPLDALRREPPAASRWTHARASLPAVLVASDNPSVRTLMDRVARVAGHEVIEAASGLEVPGLIGGGAVPPIVVLDTSVGGMPGIEVCRLLRQRAATQDCYVVLLARRARSADLLEALGAGADDVLTRPFEPVELLLRLRVAERVLNHSLRRRHPVLAVLAEALESSGGEVVVRRDDTVGHIYVHRERVVWIHVSGEPSSLVAVFEAEPVPGLDEAALRSLVEACRRDHRRFDEALVASGLVSQRELEQRVLRWLRRKLDRLLSLPSPSVLFVPHAREYSGNLAFPLDELLPESARLGGERWLPTSALVPLERRESEALTASPEAARSSEGALAELAAIEGAVGAALLDIEGGRVVAEAGPPLDRDALWTTVRYLAGLRGEDDLGIEAAQVTTPLGYHLLAAVPARPHHYLLLVTTRAPNALAAQRAVLAAVARRIE